MKRIAAKYLEFVRRPGVARLLAVAFLARLPIGMVGFSMLMYLRESLGSFTLAGSAVGAHFISMAIAAPVQGRLIDRFGPGRLLPVTGIVQPLALLGIVAATHFGASFAVVVAFAVLSGVFASPITTLTRTIWRNRFDTEEDRKTAFALDAVVIEFNFTVGPAVIALALAAFGPTVAFAITIATVMTSVGIYIGSGTLRLFKRVSVAERHLLGPLTEPRLLLVFVAMFGITVGFGILEVGYPAFATALAVPALAGVLLGINSLGSATGGAIYGGMRFTWPLERQFAACMALMSIPFFMHATFMQPVAFGVVAFLAGALIAPTLTAHSVLVSRLAPPQYATEAFTWSSTAIVSGIGTGMALGGTLVETTGLRSAFALGGVTVAAMALLTLAALGPRPAAEGASTG